MHIHPSLHLDSYSGYYGHYPLNVCENGLSFLDLLLSWSCTHGCFARLPMQKKRRLTADVLCTICRGSALVVEGVPDPKIAEEMLTRTHSEEDGG